jgi:hypothetical protein
LSDLALGIIVFTCVAVPASLLLLALADVIRLDGEGRRKRWIRNCLWALAVPASIPLGIAAWGWAGAAHLEPLCQAYASPEFRSERPIVAASLVIDSDQVSAAGAAPVWASKIVEQLNSPTGPLGDVRVESRSSDRVAIMPIASGRALRLESRRRLHHENLWFRVEMDRFRLFDSDSGITLALADELWIDAGRTRYHCGIESGVIPTKSSRYPDGDGVARFVGNAMAGSTLRR